MSERSETRKKIEAQKAERFRVCQAYERWFNTDDGKVVLNDLRNLFGVTAFNKDAHTMICQAASRTVIDFIDANVARGSRE